MNISCEKELTPSKKVAACDFSVTEDIAVTDVKLKAPAGMGVFYNGGIPGNKIIPTLPQALLKGDLNKSNTGKITTALTASGTECTGSKTLIFAAGSNRIGGNFLKLDTPKSVNFIGTVTMEIRSDEYRANPSQNEYVLWSGTGNDPQFKGINGNILGKRMTLSTSTGVGKTPIISGGDGCYIERGRKICQPV